MSLLPKEASFEELVQDVFLAFRGAGLMLSPLDAELVSSWAESGVPFEVVAWGIRRAAEKAGWDARPGDQALRSVRRCRRDVDAEIRKYLDRSAGATSPGASTPRISEHARRKLRAGLRQVAAEHPQLERAVAQLLLRLAGADLSADAVEMVPISLLRALPFGERFSVLREAHAQMSSLADGASPRGRKLARRVHRAALLRKRLGLPSFW
jgi:hypothetical protein